MGRDFQKYAGLILEGRNEALITYLQAVIEGDNVVPFNTTRTARELQNHLFLVRSVLRDAQEAQKMRELLLRCEHLVMAEDGVSLKAEELVDDFRAWKGS